jgi:hypothetical protein
MSANVEAMLREGINAVKAGNKEEGRALLMKTVELDPYNEEGWLWLSGVVESPDDQRTCLENVLSINPNNDRARQGVAYLSGIPAPSETPAPTSSVPPPPAPTPARAPTSVEWDMPTTETSSASPTWRPSNEPSSEEYDDWVSGLNLQTTPDTPGGSSAPFTVPAFSASSPFLGFDEDELDDDLGGPFSSTPAITEPPPAPAPPPPAFQFQTPPAAFSAPPKSSPPAPTKSAPQKSPALDDGFPAELTAVDNFFDTLDQEKEEESELFGYIPKEIKATRLPGTRERTPILLVVATLLLVILNVIAAVLLVDRLLTPV